MSFAKAMRRAGAKASEFSGGGTSYRITKAAGWQEMKTPKFQKAMKNRNGIEGTQSKLVRAHGARRARYLGLGRMKLQFYLLEAACNVKRWLKQMSWEIKKAGLRDSWALAGG